MSWGGGNNQDWDTVTFHKKTPTGKDATGNGALKAAMQQGAAIDTQKKCEPAFKATLSWLTSVLLGLFCSRPLTHAFPHQVFP